MFLPLKPKRRFDLLSNSNTRCHIDYLQKKTTTSFIKIWKCLNLDSSLESFDSTTSFYLASHSVSHTKHSSHVHFHFIFLLKFLIFPNTFNTSSSSSSSLLFFSFYLFLLPDSLHMYGIYEHTDGYEREEISFKLLWDI